MFGLGGYFSMMREMNMWVSRLRLNDPPPNIVPKTTRQTAKLAAHVNHKVVKRTPRCRT